MSRDIFDVEQDKTLLDVLRCMINDARIYGHAVILALLVEATRQRLKAEELEAGLTDVVAKNRS